MFKKEKVTYFLIRATHRGGEDPPVHGDTSLRARLARTTHVRPLSTGNSTDGSRTRYRSRSRDTFTAVIRIPRLTNWVRYKYGVSSPVAGYHILGIILAQRRPRNYAERSMCLYKRDRYRALRAIHARIRIVWQPLRVRGARRAPRRPSNVGRLVLN